jgi:ribokinase
VSVDVVAIGGCTLDVVHAADGSTRGPQLGGSALYAAAGARLWGMRPGIVAFRGTGLPPDWDQRLRALGLDTDGLVPVDLPASATEFFYDDEGRRVQRTLAPGAPADLVPYLPADTGEPIRRLRLTVEHIPARYRAARGAHLAPMSFPVQRELAAGLAGAILTLDPYPHVMASVPDDDLRALLAPVAAFLPSLEEARARYPEEPLERLLDRLAALGTAVVVKLGRHGSIAAPPGGGLRYIPAVPVRAVDPTGAGDAFCGGVLAGLVDGRDLLEAVVWGTVSASFAVEGFGFEGFERARPDERDRRRVWVRDHCR